MADDCSRDSGQLNAIVLVDKVCGCVGREGQADRWRTLLKQVGETFDTRRWNGDDQTKVAVPGCDLVES